MIREADPAKLLVLGIFLSLTGLLAVACGTKTTPIPMVGQSEGESVAACSQVSYGTLSGGYETSLQTKDGELETVTPPNPDDPTLVDLGLFIVEVTEINEVDSTFKLEAFLAMVWCDPRLAFDPLETGGKEKIFLEENAQGEIDRIWWPDITLVNEVGKRTTENEELLISPDGTVEYEEKFSAQMEGRYDLAKFPFDRQILEVEIESFSWSIDDLIWHEEKGKIGFSKDFEIPQWHTVQVHTKVETVQEVRDRAPFSEFLMEIEVVRRPGFYIWKMIVPLILIVAASWSIFWMVSEGLGTRIRISLGGMLAVIALQFAVARALPKIAELTFLDSVIAFSFVMMAVTVVENLSVSELRLRERINLAAKVDLYCRLGFPVVYIIGLLSLAGAYLL